MSSIEMDEIEKPNEVMNELDLKIVITRIKKLL